MTVPFQQPLNIPSKPQVMGAARGNSQADRRYMDTFWDVHRSRRFPRGRPWCGPREIAANRDTVNPPDGFCIPDLMQGEYVYSDEAETVVDRGATLAAAWSAPWRPLAKYFRFNYKKKAISFDYAKMRLEEQQGMEVYYEAAAKLGANLNLRVEYGVEPPFQITAVVGSPKSYLHQIAIAEAAMAEDPWLLGHIDEPNPKLASILGYNGRGMRVLSFEPTTTPAMTPQQVLSTPDQSLIATVERLQAELAELKKAQAPKSQSEKIKEGMAASKAKREGATV